MKYTTILLLFLTTVTDAFCQFAEISDTTKFSWGNTCPSCSKFASKASIVYLTSSNIGLCKRIYPKYSCRGIIKDSSFTIIENEYPKFKRSKLNSKSATFEFGDVIITMRIKRIKRIEGENLNINQQIATDGIPICYSEMGGYKPKRKWTYKFVKIKIHGVNISLPREAFYYFVQPDLEYIKCYYNERESKIYILGFDGDGGETLHFLWLIENGKYIDRVLSGGN